MCVSPSDWLISFRLFKKHLETNLNNSGFKMIFREFPLVTGGTDEDDDEFYNRSLFDLRELLAGRDPCYPGGEITAPSDTHKTKCRQLFDKFEELPQDARWNCPDAKDPDCRRINATWNCTVRARPVGKMVDHSFYETHALTTCLRHLEDWVKRPKKQNDAIPLNAVQWVQVMGTKYTLPPNEIKTNVPRTKK
ncbi:unnamed protein product [Bemisia tabaci]|uniref:Uncharacterized protein n=1 Tax=Bemisia tabaci TaxID=7038 RepID=A0A9P0FAQ7_BEMTA|nr:unnamed protein product [Bemisia tabaci]